MEQILISALPHAIATAIFVMLLAFIVAKIRKIKKLYHSLSTKGTEDEHRNALFKAYDTLSIRAFVLLLVWMSVVLCLSSEFSEKYSVYILVILSIVTVITYRCVRK